MKRAHSTGLVFSFTAVLAIALACDTRTTSVAAPAAPPAATQPAGAESKPAPKAEPGHFTGRVTMADGSPISVKDVKYEIAIVGVTGRDRTRFDAEVATDGTFKVKLAEGVFFAPSGSIVVPFEGKNYSVPLELVNPVKGTRDSGPGIVHNFVWRLTGPRPDKLNPSPNDANHWYGVTIHHVFQKYRSDLRKVVKPLPDKTDITWTLKPISKLIDGSEAKTLIIERKGLNSLVDRWDSLNDLPAANYEVSAVAKLPDGSTKPLLLNTRTDAFKPSANLMLQPSSGRGEIVGETIYWIVE